MNLKNNDSYHLNRRKEILLTIILILILTTGQTGCSSNPDSANAANIQESAENTISATETTAESTESSSINSQSVATEAATESTSKRLSVPCILQEPELPSGCEVTSLAIVLNYLGINADKCDLADHYLNTAPKGTASLHTAFAGDTRDPYAYGCYSEVLVDTANAYLAATGHHSVSVNNLSGSDFYTLFDEIDKGNPVIIWGTEKMNPAGDTVSWIVDGVECTWKYGQHCLVLIGYDYNSKTVIIDDPLRGTCSYDMDTVAARYTEMYAQSIVIQKN